MNRSFVPFRTKMESAQLNQSAIRSFERAYHLLESRQTGFIPEGVIRPVDSLPSLETIGDTIDSSLLRQAVVLKLNGGLGTSMGLEKAKSLLPVRDGKTFLDLIIRQITAEAQRPRFLLMNSFSTRTDTLAHLFKYPELGDSAALEVLQNKVPKIDAKTLEPVEWQQNPDLEWCPPGHGDLYTAILGSGMLHRLLENGYRYLFVSNSDNLGAILQPELLYWFANSGKSFVMEVTSRTAADRKGGHLAIRASDGRLILRESAQCPKEDADDFQNIEKHRYFNTNNLWIRLDRLEAILSQNDGIIPLPVIVNRKTVDPRDAESPAVIQLETAMGAAIECFEDAGALIVPRSRFSPVKTTGDLLALRSDAYEITSDGRVALVATRRGIPPNVELDAQYYKLVDQLDTAFAEGIPSLLECRSLKVEGPVSFSSDTRFVGNVVIRNQSPNRMRLPSGIYKNQTIDL